MVQPPMKCAVSGMLNGSPMVPPGRAAHRSAIRRTASLATGIQVGFGSPWPWLRGQEPRRTASAWLGDDRVVDRLHHQRDDGALGPVLDVVEVEDVALLLPQLLEPGPPARARPVAVGQHGLHERHRVGALAVAHRLDVGDLVGVPRRRDRHARAVVRRRSPSARWRRAATRSSSGSAGRAGRRSRAGPRSS